MDGRELWEVHVAAKEPAPALLRETVLVLVSGDCPMRGDCGHDVSVRRGIQSRCRLRGGTPGLDDRAWLFVSRSHCTGMPFGEQSIRAIAFVDLLWLAGCSFVSVKPLWQKGDSGQLYETGAPAA